MKKPIPDFTPLRKRVYEAWQSTHVGIDDPRLQAFLLANLDRGLRCIELMSRPSFRLKFKGDKLEAKVAKMARRSATAIKSMERIADDWSKRNDRKTK